MLGRLGWKVGRECMSCALSERKAGSLLETMSRDLLVLLVHVLATQKLPTRGWIFLRSATTPAPSPIRRIN